MITKEQILKKLAERKKEQEAAQKTVKKPVYSKNLT